MDKLNKTKDLTIIGVILILLSVPLGFTLNQISNRIRTKEYLEENYGGVNHLPYKYNMFTNTVTVQLVSTSSYTLELGKMFDMDEYVTLVETSQLYARFICLGDDNIGKVVITTNDDTVVYERECD